MQNSGKTSAPSRVEFDLVMARQLETAEGYSHRARIPMRWQLPVEFAVLKKSGVPVISQTGRSQIYALSSQSEGVSTRRMTS